jgi:hypothetical protein
MTEYAPEYIAENTEMFEQLMRAFSATETPDELKTVTFMFLLDLSYSRSDIYVALRRVEKQKGWG